MFNKFFNNKKKICVLYRYLLIHAFWQFENSFFSFQNYGFLRLTSLADWKGWVAHTTVLRLGFPADEGSQPVKCHCAARGGTTADAIPEVDVS